MRENVVDGGEVVLCPIARGERVALLSKCVGKGDARAEPRLQERGCAQHGCSSSSFLQAPFGRQNRMCAGAQKKSSVRAEAKGKGG